MLLTAGGVLLCLLAAVGVALLVRRWGSVAVPTPSAGGIPWPPWMIGPQRPGDPPVFMLINDTGADVLVRRLYPDQAASVRIAAGEVLNVTTAAPLLRGVKLNSADAEVALVLDVEDGAGQLRGRFEFTASHLSGTRNVNICLAAAREPPYHVGQPCDALHSCPQLGFYCRSTGAGQPGDAAGVLAR